MLEGGENEDEENENEDDLSKTASARAVVTTEDYRQSGLFLHYGIMCPQLNYFDSNLNWHNFVMSDISRNENRFFYTTREQWVRIRMRCVVFD